MKDCLFCKIANSKIKSQKIYEDKHSFAFLDIDPVNIGHTLVIPKKHFKTLADMSPKDLSNIAPVIAKISKSILKIADGMNIGQNNNRVAGQLVDHVHFHLIPRYKGDGHILNWKHAKVTKEANEKFLKKIKKLLK
jgi:histidine triad (HIT) family protein